jgi:hypothetical protein
MPDANLKLGWDLVVLLVIAFLMTIGVGSFGLIALVVAVWNERLMQRHRQPGVSYAQVTWRRDGGWRRADLFTEQGLQYQRRAAKWGFIGVGCLLLALIALLFFRT